MRSFRNRFLASAALAFAFAGAEHARAETGHDCFRRSALCWDCVQVVLPAFFPCSNPSACTAAQICIDEPDGGACLDPTRRCCASPPCELPPGCPSASSSCIAAGDAGNIVCTFPEACPPIDAGTPDAGDGGDAGVDADASDADDGSIADAEVIDGTIPDSDVIDSTLSESDATPGPDPNPEPSPSGPPSPVDVPSPAVPVVDSGADTRGAPVSLNGDTFDDTNSTVTGCSCRLGPTRPRDRDPTPASIALGIATLVAWIGRRRRKPRSGFDHDALRDPRRGTPAKPETCRH